MPEESGATGVPDDEVAALVETIRRALGKGETPAHAALDRFVELYYRASYYDDKTGLLNLRGLHEYYYRLLVEITTSHERRHNPFSAIVVLSLDIRNMSLFNTKIGWHNTTESVIKGFAAILRNCTRPTDGIARVGGDEYVVVIPVRLDETQSGVTATMLADQLCERIRRACEEHVIPGSPQSLEVLLEYAVTDGSNPFSLNEMLERADPKYRGDAE